MKKKQIGFFATFTLIALSGFVYSNSLIAESLEYIPNSKEGTVSIASLSQNKILSTIPEAKAGKGIVGVTVSPATNRVYLLKLTSDMDLSAVEPKSAPADPNPKNPPAPVPPPAPIPTVPRYAVLVIDAKVNEVIATIPLKTPPPISGPIAAPGAPTGPVLQDDFYDFPSGLAVNSKGTRLYVANPMIKKLVVFDIENDKNQEVVSIDLEKHIPIGVAVNPVDHFAYVTTPVKDDKETVGSLYVIDTDTNTVVNHIPVGKNPIGVAVTPDGSKAYIANSGLIQEKNGELTSRLSIFEQATGVMKEIPVSRTPIGVVVSPDGKTVYLSHYVRTDGSKVEAGIVSVIEQEKIKDTFSVGKKPIGISLNSDGKLLAVANSEGNSSSVVALPSTNSTGDVSVGKKPVAFGSFVIDVDAPSFTYPSTPASPTDPDPAASQNIDGMSVNGGGCSLGVPVSGFSSFSMLAGFVSLQALFLFRRRKIKE